MRRKGKFLACAFAMGAVLIGSSCERQPTSAPPQQKGKTRASLMPGENTLLGERVPAFVSVDPDGNEVDLSKHLGKDIIILDFWATWCRPCIMAMPEVHQVAEKFKDRGVVLYAVNVGEDPDTVKEFLEQTRFDVQVVMDFDGKIQSMYQAPNLPHTIVIGRDGRLQVDHMGYWRGFGAQLAEEVGALVEGKDLVGE